MIANGGIAAINTGLPELHATIAADPLVSDKCRIGLISFSESAEVLLPIARLSDVANMPGVQGRSVTSYGSAFSLLGSTIAADIAMLKAQGCRVYRPVVFFISDGAPTDDWRPAYEALMTNNPQAPHIIAFGVEGADPDVLSRVGTMACYVSQQGVSPGTALKEIMRSLTNTIVGTASTATQQAAPQIVLPPPPPGSVAVPLQEM
jgi:uncharacterized protein YegL